MPAPDEFDEFDALYDDAALDAELEESLKQVEASYSASQALLRGPPARPPHHQSPAIPAGGVRKGAFVNPQKKQKLSNGLTRVTSGGRTGLRHEAIIIEDEEEAGPHHSARPGGAAVAAGSSHHWQPPHRPAATRRSPGADEVIVRNLRDDEFGDDDWWTGNGNGLEQAEEEAIRMSQQPISQQPAAPPRSRTTTIACTDANAPHAALGKGGLDVEQLKRQIEELQRSAKEQEEMIRKLTRDKQAKEGEVAVVRQNYTKVNIENAKLRGKEVKMEQEHKAALEKLHADNLRQIEKIETATAFRRVEQDTSRRAWPSTVRRVPPSMLRDRDRRQESQVAAGLTTPTKRNRSGNGRPITPSSSSSRTPRTLGRAAAMDRAEPMSPSRRAQASQALPSTKGKSKAFAKFQNSFDAPSPPPPQLRTALRREGRHQNASAGRAASTSLALSQDAIDFTTDDAMPLQADDAGEPQHLDKQSTQREAISEADAAAYRRKQRYYWAIGELIRRRAELVGHVLGHTCSPPACPLSYPRTRYNPKGSSASARPSGSRPYDTTIHRLMNADIPAGAPSILLQRYGLATRQLNTVLTRGSISDGEERFYFLLQHDDGWEEALEDGMQDLLQGLAAALQTLMGLFVRLCMTDCLRDSLKLAYALCLAHPSLADKILAPQDAVWTHRTEERRVAEQAGEGDDQLDELDTPRSLTTILVEAIKKCNAVPISVSSPASVLRICDLADGATETGKAAAAQAQTQARRARDRSKAGNADSTVLPADEAWDLGHPAQEELIEAIVDLLEVFSWVFHGQPQESTLRFIGDVDGFLFTLLDRRRHCASITRTVRLIASMASSTNFVHACLAAKPDPQLGHSLHASSSASTSTAATGRSARSAKFPVLELLSKHLVDRRHDLPESEWHELHRTILILLTQAAIKARDTHTVLADSAPLLAALVRCLSLDSDTLWNEGASGVMSTLTLNDAADSRCTPSSSSPPIRGLDEGISNIVERLAMDARLLSVLYRYPLPPAANPGEGNGGAGSRENSQFSHLDGDLSGGNEDGTGSRWGLVSLAQKLEDPETNNMLNGIRQSFIVALNRIAFAPEPEWIEEEREMWLLHSKAMATQASDVDAATLAAGRRKLEEKLRRLSVISARLESIADLSGDLVDLVLSPDEVDEIYELLADEDDEEEGDGAERKGGGGKNEMDEDEEAIAAAAHPLPDSEGEEMDVDRPHVGVRRRNAEAESETETEPEDEPGSPSDPAVEKGRAGRTRASAIASELRETRTTRRTRPPTKEVVEIHDTDSEVD